MRIGIPRELKPREGRVGLIPAACVELDFDVETLDDVIETGRSSRAELDLVDSGSFDLAQLQAREKSASDKLIDVAKKLSSLRSAASKKLAKAVDGVLPDLGMNDGKFAIVLEPRSSIDAHGAEDIEFRDA